MAADGVPLRVRRITGAEVDSFRAPSGETLVAVLEVAVTAPLTEVEGREDQLLDQLRAVEQGGPTAAAAFLRARHG